MTNPTMNEARRAVLQLEAQFAFPPAALAALSTISGYLESLPAAHIAAEIELANLRAQVAALRVQIPIPKYLNDLGVGTAAATPRQEDLHTDFFGNRMVAA